MEYQKCGEWILQSPELNYDLHKIYTTSTIWITCIVIVLILWILGFLVHQLYVWSGNNNFLGHFVPNSESVWEHNKLIWLNLIIVGIFVWFIIGKYTKNYIFAVGLSMTLAILLIMFLFYFYTGAFGIENLYIDIGIYLLAVVFAVWLSYIIIISQPLPNWTLLLGWAFIVIWSVLLIVFSYHKPNLPLFQSLV